MSLFLSIRINILNKFCENLIVISNSKIIFALYFNYTMSNYIVKVYSVNVKFLKFYSLFLST